jgi:hypothetical protein
MPADDQSFPAEAVAALLGVRPAGLAAGLALCFGKDAR